MLDPRKLRADAQALAAALQTKGFELDLERYTALEEKRSTLQQETERPA